MLRLRAPAKLNLYLRVVGRRPDGYHEIETLFERLDLADELTFEPAPDLVLTCDDPTLPCGEDNLVMRAARALQAEGGTPLGSHIHLAKRIPIAAGLGGGSSDAAAALVGLNELWGLCLDAPTLSRLAAALGSDVPFFLLEVPYAIGRGRGEVCEPLGRAPRLAQVLVVPAARLSTKDVYRGAQFDLTPPPNVGNTGEKNIWWGGLTAPKPSITMVVHALHNGSLGELADGLWNDLEPEAIRRCPAIPLIQSRMRAFGCLGTRVSGSGPSVFGICRDAAQARVIAVQLQACAAPGWRVEILQTDQVSRRAASAVR